MGEYNGRINVSKDISQRAKKVLGDFLLNSKKGVKTPSWRILGIKNDSWYSEQIFMQKICYCWYRYFIL